MIRYSVAVSEMQLFLSPLQWSSISVECEELRHEGNDLYQHKILAREVLMSYCFHFQQVFEDVKAVWYWILM